MDLYIFCLLLGGTGLLVMACGGLIHQGHDSAGHAHAGHAHAGHAQGGHGEALLPAASHGTAAHAHGTAVHAHDAAAHGHAAPADGSQGHALLHSLWALLSPRVLFSVLLGLGTSGVLLGGVASGVLLFVLSLALGVAFEHLLVARLWRLVLRFASKPASTLETLVMAQGTAVTAFDANGQGIVRVELDGQVIQILGTLNARERALRYRVRVGQTLRIEDVDTLQHRCIVSLH